MDTRRIGQLLLMGVPGTELTPEIAKRLRALQPGGFILFGRNLESPTQLRKLIDDLRDLSETEPIITIDQEGGRVSRLRLIGSEPPSAQQLRYKNDLGLIKRHGELTGKILRLFGFNLNLCPVLDASPDDTADNSLKGRCYGRDVHEVLEKAAIFNAAMRKQGILSCGKHFPGYTNCDTDPHEEISIINRSLAEMTEDELVPYRNLLPELDSIMVCHSAFPQLDPDHERRPASLSPDIITGLLRNQLSFDQGLVMTDDLDMGAILNHTTFEDAIQGAVRAGNDLVMICHRVEMVELAKQHLEGVEDTHLHRALENIENAKKRLVAPDQFSDIAFHEIDSQIWDLRVDTLGKEEASKLSVEDGKRSPVELY